MLSEDWGATNSSPIESVFSRDGDDADDVDEGADDSAVGNGPFSAMSSSIVKSPEPLSIGNLEKGVE